MYAVWDTKQIHVGSPESSHMPPPPTRLLLLAPERHTSSVPEVHIALECMLGVASCEFGQMSLYDMEPPL